MELATALELAECLVQDRIRTSDFGPGGLTENQDNGALFLDGGSQELAGIGHGLFPWFDSDDGSREPRMGDTAATLTPDTAK